MLKFFIAQHCSTV